MRIGVIGRGFVGSAVCFGFSESTGANYEIKIFDKDPKKSTHSIDETVNNSDVIFISVPTPAKKNGDMDLSILDECMEDINSTLTNESPVLLIRSTVLPGTTRKYAEKYPNLRIVFNPEFLTERSANFDFISQTRYILGGKAEDVKIVSNLYKERFGFSSSVIETDYESAELIKYMCNLYFATKVSFLNEMKLVSEKIGANWDDCVEGFVRDGRVGNSHTNVPGPDGKKGFGGSCFPKDIQAMITFCKENDLPANVLEGAWNTNLHVRPEKDWEQLKGRAVEED